MNIAVLIPAYQPGSQLAGLVRELAGMGFPRILVVDDGSSSDHEPVFQEVSKTPGCRIIRHIANMGKGAALKTGLLALLEAGGDMAGCVTVDADGQHLPRDVLRLAGALEGEGEQASLILGSRDFDQTQVPWKSRLGNKLTRAVFSLISGQTVADTQTGLRGIPRRYMEAFSTLSGDRYEYEMHMLMEAARRGIPIKELTIQTVYINQNQASHFKPVADAVKIYRLIFRFGCSSALSFLIDIGLFSLLTLYMLPSSLPFRLFWGTFLARLVSSGVNYCANKMLVFRSREGGVAPLLKYYLLCAAQLTASWLLLELFAKTGLNPVLLKIAADTLLFLISFSVQRLFIFKRSASQ